MANEKLTEEQLNWLRKHYHDGDWAAAASVALSWRHKYYGNS